MTLRPWIEAMRLRTLPVGISGALTGCGLAAAGHSFKWLPALICILFGVAAQIASNFANEYYDYANGIDRKGREGFRRGVTEGDISPRAMKLATYGVLAGACLLGCSLIIWGGWWLVAVGAVIAVFALAYSGGPWPLSQHALGDVAVLLFYGLVPVIFTEYVQTGVFPAGMRSWCAATCMGLTGMLVLMVNNYRDIDDDRAAGKVTTMTLLGRKYGRLAFIAVVLAAWILTGGVLKGLNPWWKAGATAWGVFMFNTGLDLKNQRGARLNKVLGVTAMSMFLLAVYLTVALCMAGSAK